MMNDFAEGVSVSSAFDRASVYYKDVADNCKLISDKLSGSTCELYADTHHIEILPRSESDTALLEEMAELELVQKTDLGDLDDDYEDDEFMYVSEIGLVDMDRSELLSLIEEQDIDLDQDLSILSDDELRTAIEEYVEENWQ